MTTATLVALAIGDRERTARLQDRTAAAIGRLWDQYRPIGDSELAAWQELVIPTVQGSQTAAATARAGYLAAYLQAAGVDDPPPPIDVELALGARGVPPAEVYARPTITARRVLSEGRSLDEALSVGRARALETASSDVMLAARSAEAQTMSKVKQIVGYRRVPAGNACPLCSAAATQRYHVADLRPCHVNCHCGVAPIVGTHDPGLIVDRAGLERLKANGTVDELGHIKAAGAAEGHAPDAGRFGGARPRVHEHGELGPTLTDPHDHFTGPAGI